MSLLLHAITSPADGSPARGLRGEDLVVHAVGGLRVWATRLPEDAPPFTRGDVLANHRLVSDIFDRVRACLPIRFPTQVDDISTLDLEGFAPQLERVRDACELAVTATWRPPLQDSTAPVTATTPGRRYLQQRQISLQRRQQAEDLADHIHELLGDSVLDESRAVCPSENVALSLALLVLRSQAEVAKARIPRDAEAVRILINGPWPPYTFAAVRVEHTHGRGTGGAQA